VTHGGVRRHLREPDPDSGVEVAGAAKAGSRAAVAPAGPEPGPNGRPRAAPRPELRAGDGAPMTLSTSAVMSRARVGVTVMVNTAVTWLNESGAARHSDGGVRAVLW
jgi:hypothetical protein